MKKKLTERLNLLRENYGAGLRLSQQDLRLWRKAVADGRISELDKAALEKARIAAHKPSWQARVREKLVKLDYVALTQRTGRWPRAKQLALMVRRMRDGDLAFPPACAKSYADIETRVARLFVEKDVGRLSALAELGLCLETALLGGDTQFLREYREECKRLGTTWRRVYSWLLFHEREVEACRTPAEIWHLLKSKFDLSDDCRSNLYHRLTEVGLPMSKLLKIRHL